MLDITKDKPFLSLLDRKTFKTMEELDLHNRFLLTDDWYVQNSPYRKSQLIANPYKETFKSRLELSTRLHSLRKEALSLRNKEGMEA